MARRQTRLAPPHLQRRRLFRLRFPSMPKRKLRHARTRPIADPAPSKRARGQEAGSRSKKTEPAAPCLPLNDQLHVRELPEGPSNRLAKVSAMAVAAEPGEAYNPLFFTAVPGLGKSHLLQAIAQVIKRTQLLCRSPISPASTSPSTTMPRSVTIRRRPSAGNIASVDVWLVDDIQFIAGKDHTKEEFFHTFNALYQSGKQIVIASDRSPRELHALDERLRSRFQSGLIADINPPDIYDADRIPAQPAGKQWSCDSATM